MFHPIYYGRDPVASAAANEAARDARKAATENAILELEVERLLMITEALWTILKEEHGYDDAKLQECVQRIDLRDGKLDGRVGSTEAKLCPTCNRTLNKKRPRCIYCGQVVQPDLFER